MRGRTIFHDLGYEGAMFDRVADAVFRSDDWDKGDSGLYTTQEWLDSFIENDPELKEISAKYPKDLCVHCPASGNRTLAFVYSCEKGTKNVLSVQLF